MYTKDIREYKKKNKIIVKGNEKMLVTKIREEMNKALKDGNKPRKDTLSMLVSALDLAAKEKRSELTENEEFAVLQKEVKQTRETLDMTPSDRVEMIEKCKARIAVVEEFLPTQMGEVEIKEVIQSVMTDLGLNSISKADKGKIMKVLMPKVKGKADGKLVNSVLESMFS